MAQTICAQCHKPLGRKERLAGSLICAECDARLHPKLRTLPAKTAPATPTPPNKSKDAGKS